MSNQYIVNYEALVYNFPETKDFEFLGHLFVSNNLTEEITQIISPHEDILKSNFGFKSCCMTYEDGHSSYITAKNKFPIILSTEINDDFLFERVINTVKEKIAQLEEHIIFITNLHIFFPVVQIIVSLPDGSEKMLCGFTSQRPTPTLKWTWLVEKINLEKRLNLNIDKLAFDKFRCHKNHTRYKRAFDYYLRSFREFDHSSAFCLLCSALDAITGSNNATDTKKRLAKYFSVLFCTPLEARKIEERMRYLYKIRSSFTHGKGNKITIQDEIELREYVRRFLLSYYLFWTEMKIKNEPQMLQKLDEIYTDHSLYIRYAPAAYEFIRLSSQHEGGSDIFSKTWDEKANIVIKNMLEATLPITDN